MKAISVLVGLVFEGLSVAGEDYGNTVVKRPLFGEVRLVTCVHSLPNPCFPVFHHHCFAVVLLMMMSHYVLELKHSILVYT